MGTYIGNSPIDGYFQLDDLKQVEVLRGPQGTLYGAGALGGALRLIPNDPDLKALAGSFDVPDLCKGEQSAGAPRRHGERLVPYRPIATFHEGILDLPGSIWSFGETGCQERENP